MRYHKNTIWLNRSVHKGGEALKARLKALIALMLAAVFLLPAVQARAEGFGESVRIKISIGDRRSFKFTPVGKFTLKEDKSVNVGTDELTVSITGGRVSIAFADKTVTASSLTLESADYNGLSDYIRLRNKEHGTCTYLGNLTFDVVDGYLRLINTLPLERYLYGVVPHEMSNSFPIEALKAQAVCARSYALSRCYRYQNRSYDLVDTSKDQVYHGYASKNQRTIAAVDATAGQVLTYGTGIIEAFYSSSNGGQTDSTRNVWDEDIPYYVVTDDPFDLENASSMERLSFIPERFTEETVKLMDREVLYKLEQAAIDLSGQNVELVSTISVVPDEPEHEEGSRCYTKAIVTLNVRNEAGEEGQLSVPLTLNEVAFASANNTLGAIGAKSTRLRMYGAERAENAGFGGWNLTVRRYGHGVGLSQRSAQVRARLGQKYADILSFYYVGTGMSTLTPYEQAPKLKSDKYKITAGAITGVSVGATAEDMLKNISCESGSITIMSAKGNEKTGEVATGNFVRISFDDNRKYCDIPIVIFGDVDGSGKIDKDDIEALQKHMLYSKLLGGAYLKAADADHNNKLDIADVITLIRCINGDAKITQEVK